MKNILAIIRLAKPLRQYVYGLSFLILFGALLGQIFPLISKLIVDEIVLQLKTGQGNLEKLFLLIGLSFLINLLSTAISSLGERLGDHFSGKLKEFLVIKFYDKVLTLPQSYFDSKISGKIMNQLSRGISVIKNFVNTSTNFILPTFLQAILTLIVMAYFSPVTAFITSLLFPIYFVLSYYSSVKWAKNEILRNQIDDHNVGRIQEVISNIKVVKAFTRESKELSTARKHLSKSNQIFAIQSRTFHWFDFARNVSLNIVILLVSIVIFYRTYQGELSIGEMTLLIQLLAQARSPLFAMSFILSRTQEAEAGSKEFLDILAIPNKENITPVSSITKIQPGLSFKDVSFAYPENSQNVLSHISLKLQNKEKIALVGHSGAGKSTLINLILKFYEPTSGSIWLDQTPYSQLTHYEVRSQIALVFQENELFSTSIRENVAYDKDYSDTQILQALKLAYAYDFVMQFPKKLDTQVGERGVKLSGGQKQRIQIARAILKNSPILILDEATSHLDSISEKIVHDALQNLMHQKLVIIIAHRFSTLQNVDRVLVIDHGQLVDEGDPKELAKKPGIYSDLLKSQIEGNQKLLKDFELY